MKTLGSLIALFLLIQSGYCQNGTFIIVKNKSSIQWVGKKIGGEHQGNIAIKSSEIQLKDSKPMAGFIRIDMNSIVITDIESKSNREKLYEVLIADGFFEVHNYPESKFKFSEVNSLGQNSYLLKGFLTIKEKRLPFEIPIRVYFDKEYWVAEGEIDINRIKYAVHYEEGFFSSLGDKAIKDLFSLSFKLVYRPSD